MNIKNIFFTIAILISHSSILIAMDPVAPAIRPIDRVFLNACKNDRSTDFARKNGALLKAIDPDNGYNGLHYACQNGNIDRITFFQENGLVIDNLAKKCLSAGLLSLCKDTALPKHFCDTA